MAQGVVAEALQLSDLPGYHVGGAIHVIVNNQLGFTTEPEEGRTSRYCTAAWKAVDSLISHVNGDDVDAVLTAADLAFDDLIGSSFKINNPQATASCGCGTSFAL